MCVDEKHIISVCFWGVYRADGKQSIESLWYQYFLALVFVLFSLTGEGARPCMVISQRGGMRAKVLCSV